MADGSWEVKSPRNAPISESSHVSQDPPLSKANTTSQMCIQIHIPGAYPRCAYPLCISDMHPCYASKMCIPAHCWCAHSSCVNSSCVPDVQIPAVFQMCKFQMCTFQMGCRCAYSSCVPDVQVPDVLRMCMFQLINTHFDLMDKWSCVEAFGGFDYRFQALQQWTMA